MLCDKSGTLAIKTCDERNFMFEKFTDKARKVMSIAQGEARELGQMYVGTEHLLLALIKESEGIAAKALAKLDITYDETRACVMELTSYEWRRDGEYKSQKPVRLEDLPVEKLERRMQQYVEKEEYERAAKIQKIIAQKTNAQQSGE